MTKIIERNTTIPTEEEPGVHDGRRQPDVRRDTRPPGREADGGRQQDAREVHTRRPAARIQRRAPDRGHVRHGRRRHSPRLGQGTRPRARSRRSGSRLRAGSPRKRWTRWSATPRRKSEEDKKRHELVENRNKLDELIYRTDKSFKEFESKLEEADKKSSKRRSKRAETP